MIVAHGCQRMVSATTAGFTVLMSTLLIVAAGVRLDTRAGSIQRGRSVIMQIRPTGASSTTLSRRGWRQLHTAVAEWQESGDALGAATEALDAAERKLELYQGAWNGSVDPVFTTCAY